jgi:carbamoyltransferase
MLLAVPVVPKRRHEIPAVVHVDGTARVQTVSEVNGSFRALIEHFYELTSVPVVLNTSLNVKGQPIIERPIEALEFFASSELDYLVIEDHVVAHDPAALCALPLQDAP